MLNVYGQTHFCMKPTKGGMFVYWMRKNYIPDMLEIEAYSSENFWGRKDFQNLLSQVNIQGYVVSRLNKVVGFLMYELLDEELVILNLGVHPEYRREGVGSMLLDRLKSRLKQRKRIVFDVRETNLPTQIFLKENGFRATNVMRAYFQDYWLEDGPVEVEDAYSFEWRKSHGCDVKD